MKEEKLKPRVKYGEYGAEIPMRVENAAVYFLAGFVDGKYSLNQVKRKINRLKKDLTQKEESELEGMLNSAEQTIDLTGLNKLEGIKPQLYIFGLIEGFEMDVYQSLERKKPEERYITITNLRKREGFARVLGRVFQYHG